MSIHRSKHLAGSRLNPRRFLVQSLRKSVGRTSCAALLTTVVSFSLGDAKAQPSNVYSGLVHTALGNATLQPDPTTGALVVSDIGSSGNDGVQIAVGGSGGGTTLNLGVFNPDLLPPGASLRWAAIDPTNATLQSLTIQSAAGGSGALYADFTGLGAPSVSVALYSNDTLVAFADGIPPTTALATFTTAGTPLGGGLPMSLNPCVLNPQACWGNLDINVSIPNPIGPISSLISLPGQGPMPCTRLQISPGFTIRDILPHYQVQATTITGVNFGSFQIDHEGYVYIEHEGHPYAALENTALGQAQYDLSAPGVVRLNNLGPTGTAGVDIALLGIIAAQPQWGTTRVAHANTFLGKMAALNPQPLPPGGSHTLLAIQATGQLATPGAREQTLATLQFLNQETNLALSADLSPVGSLTVRVELWQGCTMVSSYTVDNGGVVLTSGQGATGVSVGYDPDGDICGTPPLPPWWWWVRWPGPVQVTTPGSQNFMVDHVRIAPESATPGVAALTHVRFQMVGPQTLELTSESGLQLGLNFDGNQHFPLGQATLGVTTTGLLNLGNLGPLQTDGMEVPSGGWANWIVVSAIPLPHGPTFTNHPILGYEFHATLDNVPDRVAATVTMADTDTGETQITGDMSPLGATHYTMLVLNGGVQVASVTNQPISTFTTTSNTVALVPFLRCDINHFKCFIKIKLPKLPGDPGPVIRLGPTSVAVGDEVIIMPEDALRCAGPQSRVFVSGSGADSFQFSREELGLFGNGHIGLGTATLLADAGILTVGELGVSGNNGVGINLNGSLNALARFAPLDFSAVQGPGEPVPWLQSTILGGFGGSPNQNLGSLRFTSVTGGGVQITADFTTLGAGTHTIEVMSGGQLVQRIAGHTGAVGTVDNWPTGLGEQSTGSPAGAPGCTAQFGQLVQITVNGGPALPGDELRVFPEDPSQPVGALQALNLQGTGFDALTIVGETTTPALTPTISGITSAAGGSVVLSVPTLFGYDYTLEAVDALGPQPLPWTPVASFFGDGSTQQITLPANKPQQLFRVRVQAPGN